MSRPMESVGRFMEIGLTGGAKGDRATPAPTRRSPIAKAQLKVRNRNAATCFSLHGVLRVQVGAGRQWGFCRVSFGLLFDTRFITLSLIALPSLPPSLPPAWAKMYLSHLTHTSPLNRSPCLHHPAIQSVTKAS